MNQVIKSSVEGDGMSIYCLAMIVPLSLPDIVLISQDVLYKETADTSNESEEGRC
jgi:hypothetical protein